MNHLRILALLVIACSCLIGCGGKKTNREPTYKVTGKVLYKGEPVASADVVFTCVSKNRSAFGRTNDDGEFKLTTFALNDGAVEGKYVVMVTKTETFEPVEVADIKSSKYEPPKLNQSTDPVPPKNSIPAKYSDAKKSDLIAVVNADGDNPEMVLELKD